MPRARGKSGIRGLDMDWHAVVDQMLDRDQMFSGEVLVRRRRVNLEDCAQLPECLGRSRTF